MVELTVRHHAPQCVRVLHDRAKVALTQHHMRKSSQVMQLQSNWHSSKQGVSECSYHT